MIVLVPHKVANLQISMPGTIHGRKKYCLLNPVHAGGPVCSTETYDSQVTNMDGHGHGFVLSAKCTRWFTEQHFKNVTHNRQHAEAGNNIWALQAQTIRSTHVSAEHSLLIV